MAASKRKLTSALQSNFIMNSSGSFLRSSTLNKEVGHAILSVSKNRKAFVSWLQGIIVPSGGSMTKFGPVVCILAVVVFLVIYCAQWVLLRTSSEKIPRNLSPEHLNSVSLNIAVSFFTMFFMSVATSFTTKGAQLTCALSACTISVIAAACNLLISMEMSPISSSLHPRPTVIIHARWAAWMINGPLHVFVLGHVTQAHPNYVFGAMAIQFLIVFLGYLCANVPSFVVFVLCSVLASLLSAFLICCIYVLTVSLCHFRFVLQHSKRTHNSTVLDQTMIKVLGISTILLGLGNPLMFVLNRAGAFSTQRYVFISPIFGVITVAVFLAILKATHLEGEAKRMEAIAEELKTDNELQAKFLRFVYHEIRNPFNSIMLGLSHLEEEEALFPYRELLVMLRRSANAMNRVIGDVVELTQAQGLQLVVEVACVKNVLASAVETVMDLAEKKRISIQQKVSRQIPSRLLVDCAKLKKVLEVLLSNAVKFSPPGSDVHVYLKELNQSFGFCTLQFSVKDCGPGIPDSLAPMIFQPFASVRPGDFSEDEYRGSGLGLCFAKSLTDLMSGTLTFSTNQKKGSTFTLSLSLEICQHTDSVENSMWSKIVSPRRRHSRDTPPEFLSRVGRPRNMSSGAQSKHFYSRSGSRNDSEQSDSKRSCATSSSIFDNTSSKVVPHNRRRLSQGFNDACSQIKQIDRDKEGDASPAIETFVAAIPSEHSWRIERCRSASTSNRTYRAKSTVAEESALQPHKVRKNFSGSRLDIFVKRNYGENGQECLLSHAKYLGDLEMTTACEREQTLGQQHLTLSLGSPASKRTAPQFSPKANPCMGFSALDMESELKNHESVDQFTEAVLHSATSPAQTPFSKRLPRQRLGTPLPLDCEKGEAYRKLECENEKERCAQVLVVDDVKSNRKLVCLILENAGYACDMAIDGLEAVNMARQHHYKLIIMDNVMPVMDGLEATRQILAFDKDVVVVALTGNVLQKDQQEFIQAGAKFVIEKPANKDQILKACNQFVQLNCSVK